MASAGRMAAAAVCVLPALALAGEPDQDRQEELLHLLKHDCGSCHGLTMKGGLGPPPWRTQLSAAEAAWLVRALRAGPPQ